ncbi:MAG: transcriptional repressor LexA [Deltaproteobacteria bacterium]|nr:transcriptional repressor LexA [Deltaproteobacteria bacterium]
MLTSQRDNLRNLTGINEEFTGYSLAPVQRRTLEYVRSFIADNGYAPTLKDIAEHIGVRSPSTAHFHLCRLESKGFIRRGEEGAITIVEKEELGHGGNRYSSNRCAVPLVGLIAAGLPIEAIEDNSVLIDIPPQFMDERADIYCLQVTGDSMIEAHIMDGDIIIVRKQSVAENGQIVVALLEDGSATLKTFRRLKGGKIALLPQNPNHKPIMVDTVDIQGRMIGLMREL